MDSTLPSRHPREITTAVLASAALLLSALVMAAIGIYPAQLVLPLAALIAGLWLLQSRSNRFQRFMGWFVALLSGIMMALYRPDGFSYPQLFAVESLYPGGKPFAQFINLGKFMGAIAVAIWLLLPRLKEDAGALKAPRNWLVVAAGVAAVILPAVFILELSVVPKAGKYLALFLLSNLVLTCFSEEVFYRLLVQQPAASLSQNPRYGAMVGIACATAFFVLTHFSPNVEIWLVMAIAGLAYAVVYSVTKSVLASIFTHFLVNATHFAFFNYPL